MKKLIVFVTLFIGVVAGVCGQSSASLKENFKGVWEYKAPEAPYEYSTGRLIFKEADGKPVVTVKFQSGTEINAQNIKIENDSISFVVTIEYEMVKVTGKLVGNKIAAKANSSQGIMTVTAEKSVSKAN
ncbi:MAG: hypothetical protein AB2L20_26475 [Mangrovibacterium sp.]